MTAGWNSETFYCEEMVAYYSTTILAMMPPIPKIVGIGGIIARS